MSGPSDSEERDSQLSAMFDGELSRGECDLIARRLGRDPGLRVKWSRYALVGAVVRGDREVVVRSGFCERVMDSVAREATFGDPPSGAVGAQASAPERPAARWWRPLTAVAVAASVAAVSILYLRSVGPGVAGNDVVASVPSGGPVAVVGSNIRSADESGGESDSYVTPAPSRNRAFIVPSAQLANYVVAHSEYSSPLGRRNLLSSFMAGESLGNAAGTGAGPGSGSAAPDAAHTGDGVADGSSLEDAPGVAGNASR